MINKVLRIKNLAYELNNYMMINLEKVELTAENKQLLILYFIAVDTIKNSAEQLETLVNSPAIKEMKF